jgi:4-hydroxy-tetrahydrodipicolinate synthase
MARIVEAVERNDWAAARALHHTYLPLMMINFVESNPIPVKTAMAKMGLLPEVFRLPMVSPSEASRRRIERVLADLDLVPAAAGAARA